MSKPYYANSVYFGRIAGERSGMCRRNRALKRNQCILHDHFQRGMSVTVLAKKYNLSRQMIYRVLAQPELANRELHDMPPPPTRRRDNRITDNHSTEMWRRAMEQAQQSLRGEK